MTDYGTKLRDLRNLIEDISEEFYSDNTATCDYHTYLADKLLYRGVIVPPCKVGDKVFMTTRNGILEMAITQIKVTANNLIFDCADIVFDYEDFFFVGEIGKTVFLTREEAEAAIKKPGGGGQTMTDNEIIKALECCNTNGGCTDCPLFEIKGRNCIVQLDIYAFDLIKRQQAKVEELSEILSDHIRMEYAKIRAEAITEFAEKLIEETRTFSEYDEGGWECDVSATSAEDIDRIAKEMTEDKR